MSYYSTVKYNDSLYQIKDPLGVLATLLIGKNKALLFDTCYGIGDLNAEIKRITNKELIVVASHGHMDHTGGNYQFDEVYINKKDIDLCKKHNSKEKRLKNLESFHNLEIDFDGFDENLYVKQKEGNLKEINIGDVFDLGDITCEVIDMEGHTQGSIGLYIKEMKLMLVSDATCPFVWLFLDESTTVDVYIKMLEKVLKLDFNYFLVGHGARMFDKKKMYDFLNIAKNIDLEKSVKVFFKNFEESNSYCYTLDRMYDQNGCGIVFDPRRLK